MATVHGFMDGACDYRQMYDIQDLRGNLPVPVIHKNTLLYAIANNPDVSDFFHILNKTQLTGTLNSMQSACTMFVPLNGGIPQEFKNPGSFECRQIVLRHMMDIPVAEAFIRGSKGVLLNTRGSKLMLENWNSELPILNRYSQIVASQRIGRSIVYFIDRMILPDQSPTTI